jgi:erythromycin esterase-like protein
MQDLINSLQKEAHPLSSDPSSWDPLIEKIGDCQLVLLGEASHGTHEFYRDRAIITARLIREKGFHVIAAEADWPDAYRAHRYAVGSSQDPDATRALEGFKRFPTWMWRNSVTTDFLEWMRQFNAARSDPAERVGFYGIDLYSLHASIEAVLVYLDQVDSEAASHARERYACFDHFGGDPQRYGYQTALGQTKGCESDVVAQLMELRERAHDFLGRNGDLDSEEFFSAEQNARLIANAEEYYRSMFHGRHSTWNLRDTHMAETVHELIEHRQGLGLETKLIIWAHNSHLGDARATEMSLHGEINLGQLMRESYGQDAALVGFSTYEGTVTAASDWGQPPERKAVQPGLPDSYEELFHRVEMPAFLLDLRHASQALRSALSTPRLQRAIGVIYRPETERTSHYFETTLARQFDYMIHLDHTEAVEPTDRGAHWVPEELPETYPFSL